MIYFSIILNIFNQLFEQMVSVYRQAIFIAQREITYKRILLERVRKNNLACLQIRIRRDKKGRGSKEKETELYRKHRSEPDI